MAHSVAFGQAQFQPPRAKPHYAPDRTFDLKHLAVRLEVDYPNRAFNGVSTNTLVPLRVGLREIRIHAGLKLSIQSLTVDGVAAKYVRHGADLVITVAPTQSGKSMIVRTTYKSEKQSGAGFGGGEGGWHWIEPNAQDKNRIGFWTQGETLYNRNWAPTWDYPNDFATSETTTVVPKDWTVVGNGSLVSEAIQGDRKTVHWRMDAPHATYLLSLVGGPFDVKKDIWEGKPLWYVVPRGYGDRIDDSFGDTKDMLTFFSNRFGVKYPWSKYAQNAMHDFGGGMENVSSTTLGMGSLTDRRSGYYNMSGLNAHELAHQWFGDLVSCKDWGHIWLNESWATFGQALYFEHARGKAEHDRQVDGAMRGYFGEAQRYRRALATNMYDHPDAMFDSHSYPKGAVVLHTLRRWLGDSAFFAGVKHYLTKYGYGPVETTDFARSLTETSGRNVAPFFDQWVYKPGHPVLEYAWSFDAAQRQLSVQVHQKQSLEGGTPIYRIETEILAITSGVSKKYPVVLDAATNTLKVAMDQAPNAVILDPGHDFLREMKHEFAPSELHAVAEFSPNAVDRALALSILLDGLVDDKRIRFAVKLLKTDTHRFPVFEATIRLAEFKKEYLREFFRSELKHQSEFRRTGAVRGLAGIGLHDEDRSSLSTMLNDQELYVVVHAIIAALDPQKDRAALLKASKIPSMNDQIKLAAEKRLKG